MTRPLVMESPAARLALLRGMGKLTELLRPTLGPASGTVLIEGATKSSPPDILGNAATIARRTLQIDDPFADMGAMLIRQLAWSVYEAVGDGAAIAAVLCHEIVHLVAPYVAGGGNPMMVKRGVERGLPLAIAELRSQTRALPRQTDLAAIVAHSLPEPLIAAMIGEIVETLGPDGAVLIEDSSGATTTHDYMEGFHWQSGYLSWSLLDKAASEAKLIAPRILITDQRLDAEALLPVVETCVAAGETCLLIVAPGLADSAVALLVLNRERGLLSGAVAVQAPGHGAEQDDLLGDLAAVTGGRYVRAAAGDQLSGLTLDDLGTARHAWVTQDACGLLGGGGARSAIRQRAIQVRDQLKELGYDDKTRKTLETRIGNLTGAAALIRVGAPTAAAQRDLRGRVEAAFRLARGASRDGCVPGGGAALFNCAPALRRLAATLEGDEAFGVSVLAAALAAPFRVIAHNAGADPGAVAIGERDRRPDILFDANRKTWVDAWDAGIVDPLPVVVRVLEASVSAAMMAITTDVLVRHKRPAYSMTP